MKKCALTVLARPPVYNNLSIGWMCPRRYRPYGEGIFAKEPFPVENGVLRPNMKLDRKRIVATYGSKAPQPRFESAMAGSA
jgi:hypothetical protein